MDTFSEPRPHTVCKNALQKTANDDASSHYVMKDFYVDDMLKSFPNVTQAIEISHEIKRLLSKGRFQLTKWASNQEDVIQSFTVDDQSPCLKQINLEVSKEKALGLIWDL